MLLAKKYSGLEVDVWSLGVILYTLLCGALPFDDDDENEMKNKIIQGEYEMEEFLSNEAKDLIRSILQLEPSERPTLKRILQHAWFTIKDEEEEYDDDDDWATTDDIADDESISSIEEENNVKEPKKEVIIVSNSKDSHLDATSHLERQRQEIFLAKQNNSIQNNYYPMTFTRYDRYNNNGMSSSTTITAPSAFKNRMKSFTPALSSTAQKTWGPSTSKTSRRSSIDSKAFNEKVLFTTPEEKELLEKLDNLGFDIAGIKNSVLEGKVDSASGLWWLLLTKLRKKKKIEGAHSPVTTVDVAVGTSDDEVDIEEETEEENEVDSPISSTELNRSSQEEEEKVIENSEEIIPPTPPPKTYHAAPASRERRKSLILSHPEAVEPVLTTITAMASPPLSPKKYSSFTSPISSRSVSPIPLSNPVPIPIPNSKNNHRKRGGFLSTIKGWWVGSNNPKDASAYKKSMLNWTESGVVAPADLVHTRSRASRRSGSKTPPGYDGTNSINLSRRSSVVNRSSLRDKKKKRGSIQGIKGNKRNTPAPITISPVTPSVVLSQNSPTGMLPIPGTPPAARPRTTTLFTKNRRNPFAYGSSWGRKQVKRRSIGANSINILVDNFNAASGSGSGSGSSENNNNCLNNNQENKDTFEKSAIENIIPDGAESKIIKGKSTIDEQLMVVESSKSKTIILASPPPTPPPLSSNNNNIRTNPSQISQISQISKQEHLGLQKVDASPHKISEETLASSDDGDESEYVDAASTFTSNRTASPSPSTSASPSPNDSPVIKPDGTIINPPAFPTPPLRQISISPPKNLLQSPTSPVSPPLSPTDCDEDIPLRSKKSHNRLASFPVPVRSDVLQTSTGRDKKSEEKISPIEKSPRSVIKHLMSTPPESPRSPSPRSSSPTPSSPHLSKPFNKLLHSRSHSLPSATSSSSLNIVNEENIEDHHNSSDINGVKDNGIDIPIKRSESSFRRDSSPSPPNMPFNVSQMMFLHNNGLNPRRGSPSGLRNSRRQPAMIMEVDEE